MKRGILFLFLISILVISGCGQLSPRELNNLPEYSFCDGVVEYWELGGKNILTDFKGTTYLIDVLSVEVDHATFKINDVSSGVGVGFPEISYYDLNADEIFETSISSLYFYPRYSSFSVCVKSSDIPLREDCDYCSWTTEWVEICDVPYGQPMPDIPECNYLQSLGPQWDGVAWESCADYAVAMQGLLPDNGHFHVFNPYNKCYLMETCISNYPNCYEKLANLECTLCGLSVYYIQRCRENGGDEDHPLCKWDDLWNLYYKSPVPDIDADPEAYLEYSGSWCSPAYEPVVQTSDVEFISPVSTSVSSEESEGYCESVMGSCFEPWVSSGLDLDECYDALYNIQPDPGQIISCDGDLVSVNAGEDQQVLMNSEVILDASESFSNGCEVIGYEWVQIGGVNAEIGNQENEVAVEFVSPNEETILKFRLDLFVYSEEEQDYIVFTDDVEIDVVSAMVYP